METSTFVVRWLPGAERLSRAHLAAGQQLDNLCADHLQPPEALGAALDRGDGREGGIALFVAQDDRADVERAAKDAGFEIEGWDNGTPWPPGPAEGGADR